MTRLSGKCKQRWRHVRLSYCHDSCPDPADWFILYVSAVTHTFTPQVPVSFWTFPVQPPDVPGFSLWLCPAHVYSCLSFPHYSSCIYKLLFTCSCNCTFTATEVQPFSPVYVCLFCTFSLAFTFYLPSGCLPLFGLLACWFPLSACSLTLCPVMPLIPGFVCLYLKVNLILYSLKHTPCLLCVRAWALPCCNFLIQNMTSCKCFNLSLC